MPFLIRWALKLALRWLKQQLLEELQEGIVIKFDDLKVEIRLLDNRLKEPDGKYVLIL